MTVRIAGASILLVSAFIWGLSLNAEKKAYLAALRGAEELIQEIRRSIDLFSTPKDSVFTEETLIDLERMCISLEADGEILRKFYENLGSGYKDDTIKLCDNTLTYLEKRLKSAEAEYPARARLYITLPVFAALSMIVLIF